MPRTLPWLNTGTGLTNVCEGTATSHSIRRSRHVSQRSVRPSKTQRSPRSPSTSPPPTPPNVEFMRKGDREWIMVEDEFLNTAQAFTRHLHHAEYQRLKRLNRHKTHDILTSIERPTKDLPPADKASTAAGKIQSRRRDTEEHVSAQREVFGAGVEGEGQQSDLYNDGEKLATQDRNLAGLLQEREADGSYKVVHANSALAKSRTRAAAGFSSNASRQPRHSVHTDTTPYSGGFTTRGTDTRGDRSMESVTSSINNDGIRGNGQNSHIEPERERESSTKSARATDRGRCMHTEPAKASDGNYRLSQKSATILKERRLARGKRNQPKQEEDRSDHIPMFM